MITRSIKKSEVSQKWFVVDATGVRLGKLATEVAKLLTDKDNVAKVPYLKSENRVIVLNTKGVDIHPRKKIGKLYYSHSGFPGGLKEEEYQDLQKRRPNKVIELAVKGMLPKTKHRGDLMAQLFLYEEGEHSHEAQSPIKVEVK